MRFLLGNRKRGMSKGFRENEHLTQLNLLNILELIKSVSCDRLETYCFGKYKIAVKTS